MNITTKIGIAGALVGLLGLAALGCPGTNEQCDEEVAPKFAKTRVSAERDARDQYRLLDQLESVRAIQGDALPTALQKMRQDWQGQRYTWEVGFVPVFCRVAEQCMVAPFDHKLQPDRKIVQGWMPKLELDTATHADLLAQCKPHGQCVFTFDAELAKFTLATDKPTSLAFHDVKISGVRPAGPGESWIRRRLGPAPKKPANTAIAADPNVGSGRTPTELTESDLW